MSGKLLLHVSNIALKGFLKPVWQMYLPAIFRRYKTINLEANGYDNDAS